ncbi:MAG: T9SS type A sorting domain-containing protein [Chitinophagaceae bacterium]|nr:T9SS type A sorting domain-containing protein [Chitinophagaceae bacterium]
MKKAYTQKLSFLFFAICVFGISVLKAQNTTCSTGGPQCQTITQDFNSGSGSFTGSTSPAGASFAHNPGVDGDMRVNTIGGSTYTLTSPLYSLATPGVAFMGFKLSGGGLYVVNGVIRVSILNAAGTEIAFCNLPNNIEAACVLFADADLTPQPVRYQISITTNTGGAGMGGPLVFDDFSNGFAEAALPVELKSFNARRNNNEVGLQWETASESNVRGFEVQRKSGNGSFQTIGFISSKSINGTSSAPLQYGFNDLNNNSSGANQYRIKMIDLDGRSKFSIIRSVDGLKENARILIYPNPSINGPVNVVFPNGDARDITVTDMMGRIHFAQRAYKEQDLILNKLKAGNYLLRITTIPTNKKEVYRLSITK